MILDRLVGKPKIGTVIVIGALWLIASHPAEAEAGTCNPTGGAAHQCDITCQGATCRQPQTACDGADSDGGGAGDGYCTICGNSSANTIVGGTATDAANGVKDRICGAGGDDTITSTNANSVIDGGAGHDNITASGSGSTAYGRAGNDTISVGPNGYATGEDGTDSITLANTGYNQALGGDGDDTIIAGDGTAVVQGGDGNDIITAGDGGNTLDGGAGTDTITSGLGDDEITGGADNDTIKCEGGNNMISGGSGSDLLVAGAGDDTILGGPGGEDSIYGGGGADFLDGQEDGALIVTNKTYIEGDDPVCSTTADYLGATLCNAVNLDACGYGHQCIGTAWIVTYENLGTSSHDVGTALLYGVLTPGSDSLDSRKPNCGCYHDFYFE